MTDVEIIRSSSSGLDPTLLVSVLTGLKGCPGNLIPVPYTRLINTGTIRTSEIPSCGKPRHPGILSILTDHNLQPLGICNIYDNTIVRPLAVSALQ